MRDHRQHAASGGDRLARVAAVARSAGGRWLTVPAAATLFAAPARAHGGPGITAGEVDAPTWLFLLTGVAVVAVSLLLTSVVTDRALLAAYHDRPLSVPAGPAIRRWGGRVGGAVGLLGLAGVLAGGLLGPPEAARNLAVLLVWVLWWVGLTASTYLLGNGWPAVDPFGRLATVLPTAERFSLPDWAGRWPAVAGLLLLVWLEIVTAVSADPRQLTAVVAAYLAATLAGTLLFGRESWRRQIDPIGGVFELFGRVAPIQRTDDGLVLVAAGAALSRPDADATTRASEVGFVLALLWVTAFDGFVATPGWQSLAAPIVRAGLPAALTYFAAMLGGYALLFGAYWLASGGVRRTGQTYLSTSRIAAAFAPALVPLAAGYHFAHYLPYLLTQLPAAVVVASNPLSPPGAPPVLGLPGWVGWIAPLAVLTGHLLAVWTAHSRAVELFSGRERSIRSQFPYVVVMVLYSIAALWLLAQPTVEVPFV
ncbi:MULTISPECIES: hypothetical protein [Halolamina]|uniref:Uncharacterized protein n=1 Tax=Halolamina pelagica TaxID=699431 RepID=A0A1I5V521_9EURY|nr:MULTISPECIES: hypothetical protein [Halolamina]NHX37881.1 hypothetical protein [Halolamina sp. R1-12]SFQ02046.1 hypothetical protein SAMN05216277_11610 [Halolamina pelagica]